MVQFWTGQLPAFTWNSTPVGVSVGINVFDQGTLTSPQSFLGFDLVKRIDMAWLGFLKVVPDSSCLLCAVFVVHTRQDLSSAW